MIVNNVIRFSHIFVTEWLQRLVHLSPPMKAHVRMDTQHTGQVVTAIFHRMQQHHRGRQLSKCVRITALSWWRLAACTRTGLCRLWWRTRLLTATGSDSPTPLYVVLQQLSSPLLFHIQDVLLIYRDTFQIWPVWTLKDQPKLKYPACVTMYSMIILWVCQFTWHRFLIFI